MRKKIALVAGGYSGEHIISIASARTIAEHLDKERYDVFTIIITREEWYYLPDEGKIGKLPINKNDFSLKIGEEIVQFDMAFIAIHGSPGEDGKLQGYFDMIGLPYNTCDAIVAALTFNKNYCNRFLKDYHIVEIANALVIYKDNNYSIGHILETLKLPVFVKPNESGSSLGISKVNSPEDLLPAIEKAFAEDDQVIIEEFVDGREITIGVYKRQGEIFTLPPTEILSKNEFFDYEAKYTPGITDEITPANITKDLLTDLTTRAKKIFSTLNLQGAVRMDFILDKKSQKLYFLEVNIMPGQSENSLLPQQIKANRLTLTDFYGAWIEESMSHQSENI